MYNENEVELTREEAAALAALPREIETGDLLESRVVRALRREGHFGAPSRRAGHGASVALKIAAAIALFAGGVATGRYVLASRAPVTASITAPVNQTREARQGEPREDTRAVQQKETVVAVREMWL